MKQDRWWLKRVVNGTYIRAIHGPIGAGKHAHSFMAGEGIKDY